MILTTLILIASAGFTATHEPESTKLLIGRDYPIAFVSIEKKFWMSNTEIDQDTWKTVMGSNPSKFKSKGDVLPVETVNYDDIMKFIDKLNKKYPDYIFRLPTNSEWEFAANGGKKTRYFFGDKESELGVVAWFRDNSTTAKQDAKGNWYSDEKSGSTHGVGGKMANQFGLYDIHGNLWEFTQEGSIRGGCWWSTALDCSTSYVSKWPKDTRCEFVGFRLVCQAKDKK